jgi:hypothetical protein
MLEWLTDLGSTLRRWMAATVPDTEQAEAGGARTPTPHPEHGKRGRHPVHPHTHPVPGRPRTRPPRSC